MSTINLSPPLKGPGPWMTDAVEVSLQGVKTEIQGLEWKIEAAAGKTQAHYQEHLRDLCHVWETLQEELAELARIPPPSTPPLNTPRPEEQATPTGHVMPSMSQSPPPKTCHQQQMTLRMVRKAWPDNDPLREFKKPRQGSRHSIPQVPYWPRPKRPGNPRRRNERPCERKPKPKRWNERDQPA